MYFKQCSLSLAKGVIFNMWDLLGQNLKLDFAIINQLCALIKKHAKWLFITIVLHMLCKILHPDDPDGIEKILITKEAYWMAQLFCVFPNGLNKRFEIHSNKRINYGK